MAVGQAHPHTWVYPRGAGLVTTGRSFPTQARPSRTVALANYAEGADIVPDLSGTSKLLVAFQ